MQRIGDLELPQDLDFQRRSWIAQRIGWAIMVLVLLAALAGLLGNGPLSIATAGRPGAPLQVEYGRFVRHGGPTQMDILLQPTALEEDTARVWVDREYLRGIEVERVIPEPESVEVTADRAVYVFKLNQPDQPASITFYITPDLVGAHTVRVGLDNGETLSFRQIVYP